MKYSFRINIFGRFLTKAGAGRGSQTRTRCRGRNWSRKDRGAPTKRQGKRYESQSTYDGDCFRLNFELHVWVYFTLIVHVHIYRYLKFASFILFACSFGSTKKRILVWKKELKEPRQIIPSLSWAPLRHTETVADIASHFW